MGGRGFVAAGMVVPLAMGVSAADVRVPSTKHVPSTKPVTYAGYQVRVPRDWPVYRLANDPGRCVRFDRHAVYLGTPGSDQRCPAHLVGRSEALLIQPLPTPSARSLGPHATILHGNRARPATVPGDKLGRVRLVIEGASVLVTAAYAGHKDMMGQVLRGARLTPRAQSTSVASARSRAGYARPQDVTSGPGAPGDEWKGRGFDTCAAPSLRAMRAWRRSPYGAVGIYIGGINRACPDGNLSKSWVRKARHMGWHLMPLYVGSQAPCNDFHYEVHPGTAAAQARKQAKGAVHRAKRFGIGPGNPIYFDMEAYDSTNGKCRRAVLRFLSAWTKRLHHFGYLSGVYSSVASGIRDLYRARGHIAEPDDIWFAHWDGKATVWNDPYLSNRPWHHQQRVKQYRGGHHERHGGVTINVDSDVVDADIA
ncbi:MAG: DUF1906 domain-containing protein [Streptosporangiaceae bacterium]